ncbi:hypothetical protein Tco_1403359 [Tanacetum coccineum]
MASEQSSLELALHEMTPATPISKLVPNLPSSAPFVPPSRDEHGSRTSGTGTGTDGSENQNFKKKTPAPIESTSSPFSTTVDQDAPSPSASQTTPQSQSQTIPLYAKEESHDLEVAHMSNDPYFGIPIPETVSEESSSSDVIPTTVHSDAPLSEYLSK